MTTPDISVVMSVYNGSSDLRRTVDSVLSQEGVSLEFIIVDDGSNDDSPQILNEYASRDSRIRIIRQENKGLTKALARGCAAATGSYIARQDAGDISLAHRLQKQLLAITINADAAFVSCGARFIGPGNEHLYDVNHNPNEATDRLKTLELRQVRGPSIHGCTLFARSLFETVGGYRSDFYFAQDLDLWIRLVEYGRHIVIPETLYQASVSLGSISGSYRKQQIDTAKIILECARLRRDGLSEEPALLKARAIRPGRKRRGGPFVRAGHLYFIGMCLKQRHNPVASKYFKQAMQTCPLHLKSACRLLFG